MSVLEPGGDFIGTDFAVGTGFTGGALGAAFEGGGACGSHPGAKNPEGLALDIGPALTSG